MKRSRANSLLLVLLALCAGGCGPTGDDASAVRIPIEGRGELAARLYGASATDAPTVALFAPAGNGRSTADLLAARLERAGYRVLVAEIEPGPPWEGNAAPLSDMGAAVAWLSSTWAEDHPWVVGHGVPAFLLHRLAAAQPVAGVVVFNAMAADPAGPGDPELADSLPLLTVEGISGLEPDTAAGETLATFLSHHSGGLPTRVEVDVQGPGDVSLAVDRYDGSEDGPVVALFHQGGGSARGEYGFLVPRLLDLGFSVVAADLHGGGDRFAFPNRTLARHPEAAGFTYCDALPQLQAVVDRIQSWYPDRPLVLWGSSYSGALVLHAAAARNDVDRVLAFSPASGEPMAGCSANDVVNRVEVPLLVVRPEEEAAIPSVADQLALFDAAGHAVFVASPGAHGSSTLNPHRVAGPTERTWQRVREFLLASVPEGMGVAGAESVWTDGSFDDWDDVAVAASDDVGDVSDSSAVDLVDVRVQADDRFIHLLLDVGREVTAQGMRGSLEILLDADGDPDTGEVFHGLDGVDVVVVLSRPMDTMIGAGVGVAAVRRGGLRGLQSAYGVGLLVSPTHSSDRFEIRMNRGAAVARGVRLGVGPAPVRGLVRYVDLERVVDDMGPFSVSVPEALEASAPSLTAVDLAPPDGTFRVLAWNVSSGRFRGEAEAFKRVLAALRPDVVLLDEVFEDVADEDLEAFFDDVPTAVPDRRWQWWIAEGGGPQRTVVASSAFDVRGEPRLARIPYPEGSLDRWVLEAGRTRARQSRADFERGAGLSATGAWIDIEDIPILFVPVDLQSAGYAGSPQDELRVLQAETLNAALAELLAEWPAAGLVVGGDLNVVGSDRPLRALVRGLDAGRDLTVARALNASDRSLVTWRSLGSADLFSPGRLDYVLYRDSRLEGAKAFVFDAARTLEADRVALGITATDTDVTSDHLPVVADFRIRR